jgi:hypothetical protein
MRRRVLRNALALADEAESQIVLAGRVPPPREDLLAAFLPAAKSLTRAAVQLERVARLHGEAEFMARASAASAAGAVRMVVAMALAEAGGEGERAPAMEPEC